MGERKEGEGRRVMDIGEVRGGGKCKVISLFFQFTQCKCSKSKSACIKLLFKIKNCVKINHRKAQNVCSGTQIIYLVESEKSMRQDLNPCHAVSQ
jgi:hypothetical protein